MLDSVMIWLYVVFISIKSVKNENLLRFSRKVDLEESGRETDVTFDPRGFRGGGGG